MVRHERRISHSSALPPPFQYRRRLSLNNGAVAPSSTAGGGTTAPHSSSSPSTIASACAMQHENESYRALHELQQQHLFHLQQQQQQQSMNQHDQYTGHYSSTHPPIHLAPPASSSSSLSYASAAPPHGHTSNNNYPPPPAAPAAASQTPPATPQIQAQQQHLRTSHAPHAQSQPPLSAGRNGGAPAKSAPLVRSHSHSLSHSHIQKYAREHPGPYSFHDYPCRPHQRQQPSPFSPSPPPSSDNSRAISANGQTIVPSESPTYVGSRQQRQDCNSVSNGEDKGLASDEGEASCDMVNIEIKWTPEEVRQTFYRFKGYTNRQTATPTHMQYAARPCFRFLHRLRHDQTTLWRVRERNERANAYFSFPLFSHSPPHSLKRRSIPMPKIGPHLFFPLYC